MILLKSFKTIVKNSAGLNMDLSHITIDIYIGILLKV